MCIAVGPLQKIIRLQGAGIENVSTFDWLQILWTYPWLLVLLTDQQAVGLDLLSMRLTSSN